MTPVEVYSQGNDCIGEGPLWSVAEHALYWVDIGRKRIYRKKPSHQTVDSWDLPHHPGCLAEMAPGRIAVAMGHGLHALDTQSGTSSATLSGPLTLLCPVPTWRPGTRFNDGKVDPRGRLWAGTMQNNFGPGDAEVPIDRFDGRLYRFDPNGRVEIIEDEVGIPNTLAWSPDLSRFYFGDSLKGRLFVYDFDADSGAISHQRTFYDESGRGVPDGSAIDVDGCLWNARWDAGVILKITPSGELDRIIELPVPRPTSCAFGGPDLKTLFVTSATSGLDAAQLERAPLSGAVFAIEGLSQGLAVPPMSTNR